MKPAAALLLGTLLCAQARAETVIEINPAIPQAKLNGKAKAIRLPADPQPAPSGKVTKPPRKAAVKPPAAPLPPAAAQTDRRLKEVRQKIQYAQKDLKTKQLQQQQARKVISETEAALQRARQELAELNRRRQLSWQKLQSLQNRLNQLQTEISGTKAQVARLLLNQYRHPQPDAVVLFLQNTDSADKGRLLQYTRYINQANDTVLKQLAEQQKQLTAQEHAVQNELAQLKRLAAAQQEKLRRLGSDHHAAVSDSRKLSAEIGRQSSQLESLRQNERSLNSLLAQIHSRRAAQQRAQAAAARQQQKQPARATTPTPSAPTAAANGHLSRLQGQLRRPVAGNIGGRFGRPRPDGGTWRGIFIETAPAAVHSIAAGEVAYAADLRGYGNTVIIDHGEGYLSIYTGLSSIAVTSGSRVGARQSLGHSGSLPGIGQGLYFEIRYRNRAMNPLAWVR